MASISNLADIQDHDIDNIKLMATTSNSMTLCSEPDEVDSKVARGKYATNDFAFDSWIVYFLTRLRRERMEETKN